MTACVDNKEKKGGAAKAVSATLAGVLAVGMVPAVAFAADEGSEVEAEGNEEIGLLEAQDQEGAIEEGHIFAYKDGAGIDGKYVAAPNNYTGIPNGPIPTAVQPAGEGMDTVEVTKFFDGTTPLEANTYYYGYVLVDEDATSKPATGAPGQDFMFSEDEPVYGTWAYDLETPGTYALVVFGTDANGAASNTDNYVVKAEKFTVAPADLSRAVVTFGKNTTEKSIVFNNDWYKFNAAGEGANDLHVYLNGKDITDKVTPIIVDTDYDAVANNQVAYAGSYKVQLKGNENTVYEDSTVAYIDLTVEAFDLTSANVELADQELVVDQTTPYKTSVAEVNGQPDMWLIPYLQVTDYSEAPTTSGTYSATVSVDRASVLAAYKTVYNTDITAAEAATDAFMASVNGPATASYDVVKNVITPEMAYDANPSGDYASNPLKIDYSAADFASKPGETTNSFDASKIKVTYTADKKTFEASEYDIVVESTETHEVGGIEMLQQSGTYEVYAVLDANALSYEYAGTSAAMIVTVTQGVVADADVTFAYQGKAVTAITGDMMTYDGTDQLGDITITVKTTQGAVVDPADYTVTVKKLGVDKVTYSEVDGLVGAGDYQIIVTSDKYDFQTENGTSDKEVLAVHVDQLTPVAFRVANTLSITNPSAADGVLYNFLPYTGAEIVPVIEYAVADDQGDLVWNTLPADQYKTKGITYNRDIYALTEDVTDEGGSTVIVPKDPFVKADAIQAVGKYLLDLEDGYASDAAGQNFALSGITGNDVEVVVSDAEFFLDCPTGEWYYDEVLTAANNGWIKGFNNSVFYQPHESIKRGDVCMILARMAGVQLDVDENGGVVTEYFETPFDDVDGNLYYAEAIAWASNTGIVTGYDNTGDFCPEQSVTREEFATMLARYAANMGIDTTGAAGAADEYADADAISWWAEDAVDWAVSADIMGVDTTVLAPTANISRAEAAAMVVRL